MQVCFPVKVDHGRLFNINLSLFGKLFSLLLLYALQEDGKKKKKKKNIRIFCEIPLNLPIAEWIP
jgi:hypothetical protein